MSFDSFRTKLSKDLTINKAVQDISKNNMCEGFDFVGLKTTIATIDLIAVVNADSLIYSEMMAFTDSLFKISKAAKKEFNLGYVPNPNALLCLTYSERVPEGMVEFIQKNCISHSIFHSGVVVSWVLDLKNRTIYTHNEWVSKFPPVKILTRLVFPGVEYLNNLMEDSVLMFDPIAATFLMNIGIMAFEELRERWKLRRQNTAGEEVEIDLSSQEENEVASQVENLRNNIDYQRPQKQVRKIYKLIEDSNDALLRIENEKKADRREYDSGEIRLSKLENRQVNRKERIKEELMDIERYFNMLDFQVIREAREE